MSRTRRRAVLKVGVSSKKLSQMEMTQLARWTIRPRLMSISGVANVPSGVSATGSFQVLVDPVRLRSHSRHSIRW